MHVGLFGAPGTGKSTLVEGIVRGARCDAVVIGLVGERGREAARWIEACDRRSTIVCATSDRPAPERMRAAELAMAQAERLRDGGLHVAMVLDSLARYAGAARERALALGEPAGRGGYPPSVWLALARLLERAGAARRGSITLFATVLCDGDDERDPVAENARSLLDGHVVLSPELARAGHFPAIDVLASASRTMADVVDAEHARDARTVRATIALLARTRDARSLGLATGADAALARAMRAEPALDAFARQDRPATAAAARAALRALAAACRDGP